MVNIGNMMKQAQQLQKKMAEVQDKLNSIEVEGVSGGGVVRVIASAKGEIKRINLDESLLKPEDKEIDPEGWFFEHAKKKLLSNPNKFLKDLIDYDKDHIPDSVITKVTPLLKR